jgi:two-component system NtrC family sensor kinase
MNDIAGVEGRELDSPTIEELLQEVLTLGREVHLEMDEPALAERFLCTLQRLFPDRMFAVRVLDPRSHDKPRVYGEGAPLLPRIDDERLSFRQSSVDKTGLKSAVLSSALVRVSERWYSPFVGSAHGFIVPLVASGELYGALDVGYRYKAYHVAESDEPLILPLANHLSVALRNERLHRDTTVLRDYQAKLIEHANALILGVDRHWRVTVCNQALCRVTGFDRHEVVGRDVRDWLAGEDLPRLTSMLARVLTNGFDSGAESVDVTLETRNGRVRTVWSVAAISGRGRIEAVVAIGQDQTQLRDLQQQIIQAEKLATLGQLAAGVAHELNNPLTSITVYSEYLLEKARRAVEHGREPEFERRDIEKIRRIHASAERISTFARELVQYARPAKERPTVMNLDSVVQRSIAFCEHLFEQSGLDLLESRVSDLPAVLVVPGQLEQVLINLITNASQAIRQDGTVSVRTLRVDEQHVAFVVADNGPGIPEVEREKVFEPFFTTKSDGQGSGLGLSIVRNIVEQHGGRIQVSASEQGGAAFTVILPVAGVAGRGKRDRI